MGGNIYSIGIFTHQKLYCDRLSETPIRIIFIHKIQRLIDTRKTKNRRALFLLSSCLFSSVLLLERLPAIFISSRKIATITSSGKGIQVNMLMVAQQQKTAF